jgi:2-dehydro-3-deoxyphosphooctonate aldolase (KDO 8-P synthase)
MFKFQQKPSKPYVIAGPCMAESYELLEETVTFLKTLASDLGFDLIFKASFDKANRTSIASNRGQGIEVTLDWFKKIKAKHGVKVLTDVHECYQVAPAAEVCEVLQIPAFLCRQTDLLVEAINSKRAVNVKKGQFLAPEAAQHIASKAKKAAKEAGMDSANFALTERGFSFGYGDLIVDMRSFPTLAQNNVAVIFDITHSVQKPSIPSLGESGGERKFVPSLARAAVATGYLDGFFLEVHSNPTAAKSDKDVQLSFAQGKALLEQIIPLWTQMQKYPQIDPKFS